MNELLGHRIPVAGAIAESGRSTIGTQGVSGYETPSGDTSQAAASADYPEKIQKEAGRIARQSLANGRAAKVRATQVADLGERCEAR